MMMLLVLPWKHDEKMYENGLDVLCGRGERKVTFLSHERREIEK